MSVQLYSVTGKVHEKCQKVKPKDKNQRERMYVSCDTVEHPRNYSGDKKFSPFNTVSR